MSSRILVVDDDATIVMLISHTLKGAGYHVLQAYGGEDLIRKAKAHKPDLILTDLEMPHMNGAELIRALRSDPETELIPIVVVTSHVWDPIAQAARKLGCNATLSKPFLPSELLETVRKYLPPTVRPSG